MLSVKVCFALSPKVSSLLIIYYRMIDVTFEQSYIDEDPTVIFLYFFMHTFFCSHFIVFSVV